LEATNEEENKNLKNYEDEELAQEVMLFFAAGHETTSTLLSWTLYFVSKHPHVREKILEELKEMGAPSKNEEIPPNWNFINNLPYLTQVLKETSRLISPTSAMARTSIHEEKFKDWTFPAGTIFQIQLFSIHRDPKNYPGVEDLEKYNPDNFAPEKLKNRNLLSWIPFGAGQRNCIGMQFAMVEARTLLSYLLPRFEFIPRTEPEINERTILLSSRNLRMDIKQVV